MELKALEPREPPEPLDVIADPAPMEVLLGSVRGFANPGLGYVPLRTPPAAPLGATLFGLTRSLPFTSHWNTED